MTKTLSKIKAGFRAAGRLVGKAYSWGPFAFTGIAAVGLFLHMTLYTAMPYLALPVLLVARLCMKGKQEVRQPEEKCLPFSPPHSSAIWAYANLGRGFGCAIKISDASIAKKRKKTPSVLKV